VLLARFLLQNNFMQRKGSMFLIFAVAALLIVGQAKLVPQTRYTDTLAYLLARPEKTLEIPVRGLEQKGAYEFASRLLCLIVPTRIDGCIQECTQLSAICI